MGRRTTIAEMIKQPSFWAIFFPVGFLVYTLNKKMMERYPQIQKPPEDIKADFNQFLKHRSELAQSEQSSFDDKK